MTLEVPDHILVVTKAEAMTRQVIAAIQAFVRGEFDVAITLAGAAEDMIDRKGSHLFKFLVDHPSVADVKRKEVINTVNFERDWLKHANPSHPERIEIIRADAAFMIVRAATKLEDWPPLISEFRDWIVANLDTLYVDPRVDTPRVEVRGNEITLIEPRSGFSAVYYKPADQPQLILKHRTQTDDHELLARAWKAANDKARELGWIV